MTMAKQTKAELEAQVEELRQRVEKLEKLLGASDGGENLSAAGPGVGERITPEIVLAIAAAVAAFLGKRATIHQIRLTGTTAWAMQGRATVQASHGISRWSR